MTPHGRFGTAAVLALLVAASPGAPLTSRVGATSAPSRSAMPHSNSSPACTLGVAGGASWREYGAYRRGPLELPPEIVERSIQAMAAWQRSKLDSSAAVKPEPSVAAVAAELRWLTRSDTLSVLRRRCWCLRRPHAAHGSTNLEVGSITQDETWKRTDRRWLLASTRVAAPMSWAAERPSESKARFAPSRGLFTIVVACSVYIRIKHDATNQAASNSTEMSRAAAPIDTSQGPTIPPASALGIIDAERPDYPDFARDAEIEAAIDVSVSVDGSGAASDVRILRGHPALDPAVLRAAKHWRFEPLGDAENGGPDRSFVARVLYFERRM